MKKLISILLAVVLVIGAVPTLSVTAFAQGLNSVTAALAPRSDVGLGTNYPGGTNVLVVDPFEGTDRDVWDNTSETVGTYIKGLFGGTGSCDVLSGAEATNEAILEAMFSGDYAVILIDSHGSPSSFSTRASNGTGMTSFDANTVRQHRKDAEEEGKSLHLNNALVYFSACSIMANYEDADSLSSELKASGAGVVIGDTELSYAFPDIKKNFIWCLTGFYDGEVYNAQDAFNKVIARESFVWDGNGSWELRENGKPTPEGGSGSCGTNVSYRLYSENGNKLLYIYPTSNEEDLDYSMVDYVNDSAPWTGSSITHVTIEDGVTSIGNFAFSGCTSLTSVTIPNSVTSIGNDAFVGCTSLTSVTIPDSVTSIGDGAFAGCTSLTSVTIPDSVTSIGDNAFYDCASLTSVTIPDSVTSIGSGAFSSCESLTSVTIPDSVTSIGDGAFQNCTNLPSVTIPDSVTSIESGAFMGCKNLTSVIIPDSVTSIGYRAFAASALESVHIGANADLVLEDGCFAQFSCCCNLKEITVSPDNTHCYAIDNVLFNSDDVLIQYPLGRTEKTYRIPDGITEIWAFAFVGAGAVLCETNEYPIEISSNESLETLYIPDSVDSIGCMAFPTNKIKSIYYEGTPSYIDEYAYIDDYMSLLDCTATRYFLDGGTVDLTDENPTPAKDGSVFTGYFEDDLATSAGTGDISNEQRDVYAGWFEIESDVKSLDSKGISYYEDFGTAGVQLRIADEEYPAGLRYITSLSTELYDTLAANGAVNYGYVAIDPNKITGDTMLTSDVEGAVKAVCSSDGQDHINCSTYRLFTLVITYEGGVGYDKYVVARPYIEYTDANGIARTYYASYKASNPANAVGGGCRARYSDALNAMQKV